MRTTSPRVFITGYGVVSALDSATAAGFPIEPPGAEPEPAKGGERPLTAFEAMRVIPPRQARQMDRFTQIGYVAVKRALEHASLDTHALGEAERERCGIVLNTCYGPFESTTNYLDQVLQKGAKKAPAAVFPNTVYNAFTGKITMDLSVYGTNSTVSGTNPLIYGFDMIRQGYDDVMIVGGCEELSPRISSGFRASGYLDEHGFVLGEGAAVLVLESEAMVQRRGVRPLAEVVAFGLTQGIGEIEAFPIDDESLRVAMGQALERGGVSPAEVDFVCAHASGHASLDAIERRAIESFFGDVMPRIDSAKRFVGETLGAAAAFGTIYAVDMLCRVPMKSALINNVEYGGACASVLVTRVV